MGVSMCEIKKLKFYKFFGAIDFANQSELFSLCHQNISNDDFAFRLDREFNVQVRTGLHCSPMAHKAIGTYPYGTVRFAPSIYHRPEDLDRLLAILFSIINCLERSSKVGSEAPRAADTGTRHAFLRIPCCFGTTSSGPARVRATFTLPATCAVWQNGLQLLA